MDKSYYLQSILNGIKTMQVKKTTAHSICGEFQHTLTTPYSTLSDYNFLTGYAILHLSVILKFLKNQITPEYSSILKSIISDSNNAINSYRTTRGAYNWYKKNQFGLHCPEHYTNWQSSVLSLRDDLDDTAIAAILETINPVDIPLHSVSPSVFTQWLYTPGNHSINPKSQMRLEYSGTDRDVFMTWIIMDELVPQTHNQVIKVQWIPDINSIELVTAANIWTALYCSMKSTIFSGSEPTRAFINNLVTLAIKKCINDKSSWPMEFCAPYYPRAVCAPLSFLLRDHALSDRKLLDDSTILLIAELIHGKDSALLARDSLFAGKLYWLNCIAWGALLGITDRTLISGDGNTVLHEICREYQCCSTGQWPDFTFFLGAHIGDYSGSSYVACLTAETLALLNSCEV